MNRSHEDVVAVPRHPPNERAALRPRRFLRGVLLSSVPDSDPAAPFGPDPPLGAGRFGSGLTIRAPSLAGGSAFREVDEEMLHGFERGRVLRLERIEA